LYRFKIQDKKNYLEFLVSEVGKQGLSSGGCVIIGFWKIITFGGCESGSSAPAAGGQAKRQPTC